MVPCLSSSTCLDLHISRFQPWSFMRIHYDDNRTSAHFSRQPFFIQFISFSVNIKACPHAHNIVIGVSLRLPFICYKWEMHNFRHDQYPISILLFIEFNLYFLFFIQFHFIQDTHIQYQILIDDPRSKFRLDKLISLTLRRDCQNVD